MAKSLRTNAEVKPKIFKYNRGIKTKIEVFDKKGKLVRAIIHDKMKKEGI